MVVNRHAKMRRHLISFFLLLAATLPCFSATVVQSDEKLVRVIDGALSQVPARMRARLLERLERYVESIRAGQFANIYDLMPDACRHGLSRVEWIKQVRYEAPGQLNQLVVDEVFRGDYTAPKGLKGEKWIVHGCGTYSGRLSGRYITSYSTVFANDEWYICHSGVPIEPGTSDQYIRCPD